MKLTSFTNYSLRVLMVAAARDPALTTIQEVADSFTISRAHLVKCVHLLGGWGYLDTVRGNKGGFRLARPAAQIVIGEVIRRTEDGFNIVECFDPATNTCPMIEFCRLNVALQQACAAFLAVLDGLTLADLADSPAQIRAILIPPPQAGTG